MAATSSTASTGFLADCNFVPFCVSFKIQIFLRTGNSGWAHNAVKPAPLVYTNMLRHVDYETEKGNPLSYHCFQGKK
jgi:hypothetical protein